MRAESKQTCQSICHYPSDLETFPTIDAVISSFQRADFLNLHIRKRFKKIHETLSQLIEEAPSKSFLLKAVLDFFSRINKEKVLNEPSNLATYEFWLNHFSEFSDEKNSVIRSKIAGKALPRSDYQQFFPVGMGRIYNGTHFVTAHLSPDVDTMIASFWGWIDAFAARVGSGLHLWNLPGGPPQSPITGLFAQMLGSDVFSSVARTIPSLSLTAMDLVTQKMFIKEIGSTPITQINHGTSEKAVILVDEKGNYLSDWRSSDAELIHQVIILYKSNLHWIQNAIQTALISLFAKAPLTATMIDAFHDSLFLTQIKTWEPTLSFNPKQKQDLTTFIQKILLVEAGLDMTLSDLSIALEKLEKPSLEHFRKKIKCLREFVELDAHGNVKEEHHLIFPLLLELFHELDKAIFEARSFSETLGVGVKIKQQVLSVADKTAILGSGVEEIRSKMIGNEYLTVVSHDAGGALFPIGIIRSRDLMESGLGTVSFRDFCNFEEVRMAPYLDVISVVDHHKSSVKTLSIPTALIGDAQSCNVLIAEQMFILNDRYSLGGMSKEAIEKQIEEMSKGLSTPSEIRIFQKLLQRRMAANSTAPFYVHPRREFTEYLSFIHAILDDTDLLTKMSHRDVACVAELLNRLKSLSLGHEVEIIQFDDLVRDSSFVKKASQRILQQEDMYALYKQIYASRESETEAQLHLCVEGKPSALFLDSKEQNGCARIGQTKLFSSNFPYFTSHVGAVRQAWLELSQLVFKNSPEIDLYIHMISTIANAEEVHSNKVGPYNHFDELWFWIPNAQGYQHLNHFLNGFQNRVQTISQSFQLEIIGSDSEEMSAIFKHQFPSLPQKLTPESANNALVAILRFEAGLLNSRKAMISPFLPKDVS